ncbi:MAG TPA: von Willebrand factor type A domain-containing protein [Bacilli bacterium]|nr:von Willebrand factor type A domain-containing protein [Bacilli bacterium]HRS30608.1 von Willebrand factor type A domain-containing protein [Bacilli bacterium]HRU49266.1 von Willebrand factor type A domain-containing protein [Bacilli bacterium]
MKRFFVLSLVCVLFFTIGCASKDSGYHNYVPRDSGGNLESYLELVEKGYIDTATNNKVNVSLDSSNAAYSNIRRLINNGRPVVKDAVNIEQMLNYFNYSYVNDTDKALKIFTEVADCPWNDSNKLVQIGIKAKEFELDNEKPNNFVFLLDVSGSMGFDNKLPLMINAFKLLIDNLNDQDRISIVTYAAGDKVVLDGGFGFEKTRISAIVSDLTASGSTHGSKGIYKAYELAEKYFVEGGNNRVFLGTDGDFNVGITSIEGLKRFISQKRETGVYLTVLGFGEGNLKASTMDTLAQAGNGNYYYIDSILEAQKVFVSELGGTLMTVAKDTKAQVEFNPEVVEKYRVIGYENKILTDEEFENEETDAGEIGAGHTTVCLIEIVLKENQAENPEIFKCTLRYKDPTTFISNEIVATCSEITEIPSNDFIFASGVAEFGLLLRDSEFKSNASYNNIIERIDKPEILTDAYRQEFLELVRKVRNGNQN